MPEEIWRDLIPVHPAADLFPMMSDDELDDLAADIRKHDLCSPVVLLDRAVLDGRNRLEAAERAGIELFKPDGSPVWRYFKTVGGDSDFDPVAYVVSANIHRRHLTAEKKRELIAALLKDDPARSNRAIADLARASDHTVANVRKGLEYGAQIAHHTERVGRDGVAQPATKRQQQRQPPAALVNNTVPRHLAPGSVVGQFKVAAPAALRPEPPSVVGAFKAGGATSPSPAPSPTPAPLTDFEAQAARFLEAVAARRAVFGSGTLFQRCQLAVRFLNELDVAVEELDRFINSPDDGAAP